MNIAELDNQYIAGTYGRFPLEIAGGNGEILWDNFGKKYIDMGSGIAVNTFGMCDTQWKDAVIAQLSKFQHTSNLYYTSPCTQLAKLMCEKTGYNKVFFSNSGAEANECAIKAARKYACDKKGEEYYHIITLENSFHGRTITTLAATGQDVFHEKFKPLTDGFLYAKANDFKSVLELTNKHKVAAIMIETVQGEGGVNVLTKEFVSKVSDLAKKEDIILIVDEVQTGNGRTGALYSFMNYNIKPDIFTTAKGLGAGLPIGATVFNEKTGNVFDKGDHGSTFGGNPVCCAGAVNVMSRLTDEFLAEVNKKSQYIVSNLQNADGIKSVSGLGLMLGIETEKDATEVIDRLRDAGVLALKAKNKVRLLPPLNIRYENLDIAINKIKEICK